MGRQRGDVMLIWNGKGYLVVIVAFISALGTEYLIESYFADQNYYQAHGWPLATALVAAGIICWFLGSYLYSRGSRTVIDKATGQEMTIGGYDALFFIPMRYWGAIFAAAAISVLAYRGF
jgi:hypothetical protein